VVNISGGMNVFPVDLYFMWYSGNMGFEVRDTDLWHIFSWYSAIDEFL